MIRNDDTQPVVHDPPFWYSTIEVVPGVFSPGLNIPTIALARAAMRAIPIEGLKCLDVGTVEGVMPVLLTRGKAQTVVAYDRVDWTSKSTSSRRATTSTFDIFAG